MRACCVFWTELLDPACSREGFLLCPRTYRASTHVPHLMYLCLVSHTHVQPTTDVLEEGYIQLQLQATNADAAIHTDAAINTHVR